MLGKGIIATFPMLSITANTPRRSVYRSSPRPGREPLIYRRHNAEILARVGLLGNDEYVLFGDTGGIHIQVSCQHLMVDHRGQPGMRITLPSHISFLRMPRIHIEVEQANSSFATWKVAMMLQTCPHQG
ncbi:hypothetical protein V2G26_015962 [Clonostachys chloroleuca]